MVDQLSRLWQGDSWWYERAGVLDRSTLQEVQITLFVSDRWGRCCITCRILVGVVRVGMLMDVNLNGVPLGHTRPAGPDSDSSPLPVV